MAGPSRYNRKLKAKNDRRRARASRGGRTASEAGLGRSMAASGRRVSRTNRAAGKPIRSLPKSGRSPVVRRARRKPRSSPIAPLKSAADFAGDKASDVAKSVGKLATTPVAPGTGRLTTSQRADLAGLAVPGGAGIITKAPKARKLPGLVSRAAKSLGIGGKKPKPITAKPPKPKGKKGPTPTKRKQRKPTAAARRRERKAKTRAKAKGGAKRAGRAAARTPQRNPVLTTGAAAVAADRAGVGGGVIEQVSKDVRGTAEAFAPKNLPTTAKTTARSVPGILAGVTAPIVATGQSLGRATQSAISQSPDPVARRFGTDYTGKEITSPVVDTTKEAVEETKAMLKPFVSGSKEDVTKAVKDEIGALPLVLTPKAVQLARRNPATLKAKRKVRQTVSERRDRRDAKKPEKAKPRVKDKRDGGEFVIRPLGRQINNRRERIEASRQVTRTRARGTNLASREVRVINRFVRAIAAPSGKNTKKFRKSARDAIATVAVYGIARDPRRAMVQMREAEAKLAPPTKPVPGKPAPVTDRTNFDFLRNNPEVLRDPNFWKAVDTYKSAQKKIETSDVKKWLAVGATYGIRSVDDRLSDGVTVAGRKITTKYYDPDTVARKQLRVKKLRQSQRYWERQAKAAAPDSPKQQAALKAAAREKQKADKLRDELRDFNLAVRKAKSDFVNETRTMAGFKGVEEPAYVKSVRSMDESLISEPRFQGNRMASKQYRDLDKVRRAGTADRSFETLARGSVLEPRMVRLVHNMVGRFVAERAIPVATAQGSRRYLTSSEIRAAIARNELDPKQHAVLHSQHFRRAIEDRRVNAKDGEYGMVSDLAGFPKLAKDMKERGLDKGQKYVVLNKAAARELAEQFDGKDGFMAKANRNFSRVILGYNPSWAAAQLLAEGVPAAVAIGANPARYARIAKARRDMKKESPETQAAWDSLAGQTAGTLAFPKPGLDTRGRDVGFANAVTAPSRTKAFLTSVAKGEALGKFDRWKGGGIRKAVVAAQVDKEFNGFMRGLSGATKLDEQIRRQMKGKTLAQQQAIVAKNPQLARRYERYLDDVMGNWRAITSLERGPASLTAFYPFVRYSITTAFWRFPKRHPIKSSILYFFAQQNANQLEKLVDGEPLDWLNYAFPVITADGKGQVAPSAARYAPALSAVVESIGKGEIRRVLSGINPAAGAVLQTIQGQDSFTGQTVAESPEEHLLLGLAALASMVAPVRTLDDFFNPDGDKKFLPRGFRPRAVYGQGDPTKIGGRSETSKALRDLDPGRRARGIINVLGLQSGEDFKKSREIINTLGRGEYYKLPGSASQKKARRKSSSGGSSSGKGLSTWGGGSGSGASSGGSSSGGGLSTWGSK